MVEKRTLRNYHRFKPFDKALILFLFTRLEDNSIVNIVRITGFKRASVDRFIDKRYKRKV